MQNRMRNALMMAFAAAFIAAPATAQQAHPPKPYAKQDSAWISIDGTVESIMRDRFTLDYGPGVITVEMDDSTRDADGYKLMNGDKVRVTGRIDADLMQTRTIEAATVFVENLGRYFYASPADEEGGTTIIAYPTPVMVSASIVQGTVTSVDDETFTVSSPAGPIVVEVENMAYNPLDQSGYQRIEVGDLVSVSGQMDTEFFDANPEIEANAVLTLRKN